MGYFNWLPKWLGAKAVQTKAKGEAEAAAVKADVSHVKNSTSQSVGHAVGSTKDDTKAIGQGAEARVGDAAGTVGQGAPSTVDSVTDTAGSAANATADTASKQRPKAAHSESTQKIMAALHLDHKHPRPRVA
ncbi:hypothetical protein LTS08_001817 [Lithohypha guttulata]|uniref:Uncharacterized protein n=1 Tax=Lithohypha guttulata TaxID=1690604 RepID=A0AAN7SUJ3_9EURO|nr:hypothetical protein LTR51_003500 [Lithohypha guttulata]KAK5082004.1 hypothetical protein LTR05_007146 [Lithohypha guttulata]KAK5105540.1 hypothetical protein LTS08_001817 [Lithohypha guttulata]